MDRRSLASGKTAISAGAPRRAREAGFVAKIVSLCRDASAAAKPE